MLYGYCETLDNRIATIVSAADTVVEYDDWVGIVISEKPYQFFSEVSASVLTDHLFRTEFKGYKRPVLLVYHDNSDDRESFVRKWEISMVKSETARDRQKDMIWKKQQDDLHTATSLAETEAAAEGRELEIPTIEEISGLVENDPWDRRSPEMKVQDAAIRQQMKDLQKKGTVSGDDSFGDADAQRKGRAEERGEKSAVDPSTVKVTDVRGSYKGDGGVEISSVIARKFGGDSQPDGHPIPEARKRYKFTPEDFAAVLAGDGSADHLNIPASPDANKMRREPGSSDLNLSEEAQAARREFQEEQRILAEAAAEKQRGEEAEVARQEHQQGIFRGCDLWPDQQIDRNELPEKVRELLDVAKITLEKLPLKVYPLNSQLGDHVLLPSENLRGERPLTMAATENLNALGVVQIGEPRVIVATKRDATLPGWAIYTRRKEVVPEEGCEFDITVVKIH